MRVRCSALRSSAVFIASLATFAPLAHSALAEPKVQTTLSVVAKADAAPLGPEASALFERARALHKEKKWSEAREAYERAWQIQKSFQIAANLALVELRLGRARDAAEHLSFALLHLPPNDPKMDEVRTHLDQMMKEATAQIGTLELMAYRQRATIYVDGAPAGSTPLRSPIYVEAGHHVLHVDPDGAGRITQDLVVEPGVVYQLSLSSTPLPNPTRSAPAHDAALSPVPAPPEVDRQPFFTTPRFIVLAGETALTLAALGFATVYAFESSAAQRDVDNLIAQINANGDPQRVAQRSMCDPTYAARPPECDDLSAAVDDANAFARKATIGFIAAGGLAAGTIATYFLWAPPQRKARGAPRAAKLVPRVTATVSEKVQMIGVVGEF